MSSPCGWQEFDGVNVVRDKFKRLGLLTFDIAWAGVILLLPITSLPLLSQWVGNTLVAPASFLPLCWLAFWFIFYIFKKGTLPRETIPFLLFTSIAVIASAYAFYLPPPSFKGGTVFSAEFKALLTLVIGTAFYLLASSWLLNSHNKLTYTLKLIDIGGLIMLSWALIQGIFIYFFHGEFPDIISRFQMLISMQKVMYPRMNGFAYEPSWLAQQLNLLYLPFWLAATLAGFSAFRFRIWKISLENILLTIGIVVLFLSSRVGTLSPLLIIAFLGIYFNVYTGRRLQKWASERFAHSRSLLQWVVRHLLPIGIIFIFLGVYALGAIALVYGLSHVDLRLAHFFQVTSLAQFKLISASIYTLFDYLSFAERYVYWVAGWRVFNMHPFIGVGLGNAGFYFHETLPAYSWNLPEVLAVIYRFTALPNIKSLWVRLLAETGIVGFSSFLVWCSVLFRSGWILKRNPSRFNKTIGWFGIFVLLGLIFEGFSTDTFALPYLWISMGIVSAVAASVRNSKGMPV